jgi:hypothetical protein
MRAKTIHARRRRRAGAPHDLAFPRESATFPVVASSMPPEQADPRINQLSRWVMQSQGSSIACRHNRRDKP